MICSHPMVDVAPRSMLHSEATVLDIYLKSFMLLATLLGVFMRLGESSSAVTLHMLVGLAPWALRTEALGNVLERVPVLKSGENATLKKRLAETETKLAWACMERDIAEMEGCMRYNVVNKMFLLGFGSYWVLVRMPAIYDEDTEPSFREEIEESLLLMGPRDLTELRGPLEQWVLVPGVLGARWSRAGSAGAGGGGADGGGAGGAGAGSARVGTEGAVGLCQWFEKLESVFRISDCKERDKVNLQLLLPRSGIDLVGWMEGVIPWVLSAVNCTPRMRPKQVKVSMLFSWVVEEYTLVMLTSSRPDGIDEDVFPDELPGIPATQDKSFPSDYQEVVGERFYSIESVAVGSSGSCREEECGIILNVHCITEKLNQVNDQEFVIPLPRIDDLIRSAAWFSSVYSKIDYDSSYHLIRIAWKNFQLQRLGTRLDIMSFKVMPF
ncbi:hypothetical protein Tco_1030101 [Tanacetum coccineum]|uniref:Uncharacterized protein n=1 Tax=Tanacetum coccineum TaxID=301880 RepID=A0ABQ5G6P0_9ASTR